jgi:putative membrane protein
MSWNELQAGFNACLNGIAAISLVVGYRAIRRGDRARHRLAMLTAIKVSGVFLVSYLLRVALFGTHSYRGEGLDKVVYLAILGSHTLLAFVALPLVLVTAWLALRGRLPQHRRIARITWPIWAYVSFTGVVVYLLLYQLGPRLHPGG